MKFILFASIFSFAIAAAVAPPEYGNNPRPYEGNLPQKLADDIANGFISVLQGKAYKGQPPSENYKKYVEPKYVEYSGSINSLISKNNDVNAAVVSNREDWYNGAKANPIKTIKRSEIYAAGPHIIWYFLFGQVGSGQYDVSGFALLRISKDRKVREADIEFNSIAWGVDTKQILQYCPACTKPTV